MFTERPRAYVHDTFVVGTAKRRRVLQYYIV